jgi:hypothetical protein
LPESKSASAKVVVAERFHGPPRSGNGGYVCGLAASFVDGPAESTLRAPPPLDVPLDVIRDGGDVVLRHAAQEIARAKPARPRVTPPPAPGRAEAARAASRFRGHQDHIFPGCFVCGPAHPQGLHIFAGPLNGDGVVAAPWTPSRDLADADGRVAAEFLWAALDCPSYWSLPQAGNIAAVLGRLTAEIVARPNVGDPLVVTAWPLDASGRKHRAGSAIFDADGGLIARAEALWIEIKPENFQ